MKFDRLDGGRRLMKKKTKGVIAVCTLSFLTIVFLIGIQSYFNKKEINLASDKCYGVGGMPKIESEFLALDYSFSCQLNK